MRRKSEMIKRVLPDSACVLFNPEDDADSVMALLNGENVNECCIFDDEPVFQYAIRQGATRCVMAMLNAKADPLVYHVGDGGWNPFMSAVYGKGGEPILQLLLEAKADPTYVVEGNWTVLHAASSLHRTSSLSFLLQCTPRSFLDEVDSDGLTPLDVANWMNSWKCADLLVAAGAHGRAPEGLAPRILEAIAGREQCRVAARVIYGVFKFRLRSGRDMARLMTQHVWATRMQEAWRVTRACKK